MNKYVVIDVETTGQSPKKGDRIIELALIVLEDSQITCQYNRLINPERSIPPFITQLTSITNEEVENEVTFQEIIGEIKPILENAILVAHNVSFDLFFLNAELERAGEQIIEPYVLDTVELSRILFPTAPSYKLNELSNMLMISHDNPHRAISDALVTADLFIILFQKLISLPAKVVEQLMELSNSFRSDLFLFKETISGQTDRRDIIEYRGICLREIEPLADSATIMEMDFPSYLEAMYHPNGQLSQQIPDYEKRESQIAISEAIYDHFRMGRHALIEAETGIGKTIAYLLPAAYEALHFDEQVVISTTHTNLQSQLMDKDLHKLHLPVTATVIKGKNHYLSLEKFEIFLKDTSLQSYQENLLKASLLVWLTETTTGDLDEIQSSITKNPTFYRIRVNHYPTTEIWREYCFYHRVRERAKQSHLIVTNHALLSVDMMAKDKVLPDFQRLIVDEAHQLEPIAARYLGKSLSYVELVAIIQQLMKSELINSSSANLLETLRYECDILFRQLFQYVKENNKQVKSVTETGQLKTVWLPLHEHEITDGVDRILLLMKRVNHESLVEDDIFHWLQDTLHYLLKQEHDKSVTWLEIDQHGAENAVFIRNEPFTIAPELSDYLIKKKEAIIFMSGTLTLNQSFDYIRKKLGLENELVDTYQMNDYFDYKQNVQLKIPNDLPAIRYPNNDEFIYAINESIVAIAEEMKGKLLVLFTSYEMLKKSYYILKEVDILKDYLLIAQGVSTGSRNRLIKQFQSFEKTILLGTNAYWQGIDIPGEDLSCLIIVKLPFQSPQDPVYEKKADFFRKKGVNPFMELALPHAVLQFKQGLGRLVRKKSDKGIVFVFDDRLMTKRYGRTFLQSIPNIPIEYDSMNNLLNNIDK